MSKTSTGRSLVLILSSALLATTMPLSVSAQELDDLSVLEPRTLVEAVLARNPDMEAIQAAWDAQKAAEEATGALDDPMLSVSVAPFSLGGGEARTGYGVQVEQRFPFPGKRGLARQAAREEARMAGLDHEDFRLELARVAVRAYADYVAAHESLTLKQRQEELARETVTIAEGLYTVGRVPQQEPLQAELERVRLEHDRIVLETAVRLARTRLNTLLHRSPDAALPPPASLPEVRLSFTDATGEGHPRLQAAQAGVDAAAAAESLARRQFWPDFGVMAGYENMWEMPEHRWMLGATINVPLQRNVRHAAVDESRYRGTERRARLQSEQARLAAELADARHRAQETHHDLMLLEERTLPVARAQLEAAQSAYEAGQVNLTALLDAQRSLWAFEEREVNARAELAAYLADYNYALGLLPRVEATEHDGEQP